MLVWLEADTVSRLRLPCYRSRVGSRSTPRQSVRTVPVRCPSVRAQVAVPAPGLQLRPDSSPVPSVRPASSEDAA